MSTNNQFNDKFVIQIPLENHKMLIYNIHIDKKEVIDVSVGLNIKRRRLELRMSQQELADAMGYKTRSTVAKIESGENDVSQKKIQKFASVLNTTVEALVVGQTSPAISVVNAPRFRRNKCIAVVLAGGISARNRQNVPSQFVNVHGKPILVYGLEAYQSHPSVDDIYVVCLKGWETIVKAYAEQYGITKLKGLIPAGTSGTASLRNAWEYIRARYSPDDVVIVQESTRPLVTPEMLSMLLGACDEQGSATICHSMKDYVQFDVSGGSATYVDRSSTIALQSPEAHRLSLLNEVFEKVTKLQHNLDETCCTMLLYHLGFDIHFVESPINNIKIAADEDIAAFGALVKE